MSDEENFTALKPGDQEQQMTYLRQLQWRYPEETSKIDENRLMEIVRHGLHLCPPLRIDDPKEIVRFLALSVLLTPGQKRSALICTVVLRVMMAVQEWRATKRLNFVYKFVIGRAPPALEPDFGPWFILDTQSEPAIYQEFGDVIFANLD